MWKGHFNNMTRTSVEKLLISHRCPTYQLHLPPKTQFGDPKNPLQGNAGKFREIQGFLLKTTAMPRKTPIQGISGNSFWGSRTGILGWFSWADENGQSWYVGHGGLLISLRGKLIFHVHKRAYKVGLGKVCLRWPSLVQLTNMERHPLSTPWQCQEGFSPSAQFVGEAGLLK